MAMRHAWRTGFLALALVGAGCEAAERDRSPLAEDTTSEIGRQLGGLGRAELDTASAARLSGAFRGAAAEALASVVQIEVISRGTVRIPPGPFHNFELPMEEQERVLQGSGSGFIIDDNGHIITNHHVVENAIDVKVRLVDGREFNAHLVGSDPNSDVAVIRVEARDPLPTSRLGNSDEVRVGDWVLALGSPLGLRFSVTAGIVSAMNRTINILGDASGNGLEAFIQTDAAINPGNSGGPLVDLQGRVVGVNSAIESQTGYFSGAGFAIPINLAYKFATDLIQYGVVHRPQLGVRIAAVSAADAEVYGLPGIQGVEINQVIPGEAAERAGVQMGDVVTAINGVSVDGVSGLQATIAQFKPGESVQLSIIRYGQPVAVAVKLGEFAAVRTEAPERTAPAHNSLGFTVAPLPQQYAGRIGRRGRADVPLVRAVEGLSPAAAEGVRPGYAILRLNGREVNVSEVRRLATRVRQGDVISLVLVDPRAREPVPLIMNYRVP